MGTTLTGTTPQDTYDSLIKVTDNGPISGTAKFLSDGLGNDSALALSTTAVGIGTAAPTQLFHVQKNSAAVYSATTPTFNTIEHIRNATSGTGANSILNFTSEPNGEWYIGCVNKANFADFVFASRDAAYGERMRITSAGNVGIGTNAPSFRLTVDTGVVGVLANFTDGIAQTFRILSGSGFSAIDNTSGGAIAFQTAGVERARITNDGLTFNGDTAAANALDDYEEGTWTIGISFGGASVGVTTLNNTGTYTKVGRQVTVNGRLSLTSKGSSTGAATITGLPFAVAGLERNRSAPSLRLANISFANAVQGIGSIGNTVIDLEEITEAGSDSALTNAEFVNTSDIILAFTYFV